MGWFKGNAWRTFRPWRISRSILNSWLMLKSDVMLIFFFPAFLRRTPPTTCLTEVLPDSVFGISDESVAESGTVNVGRTDGDELQRWILVSSGLSSSRSPCAPLGFVAEAKQPHSVYYWHVFLLFCSFYPIFWIGRVINGEWAVVQLSSSGQTLAGHLGSW